MVLREPLRRINLLGDSAQKIADEKIKKDIKPLNKEINFRVRSLTAMLLGKLSIFLEHYSKADFDAAYKKYQSIEITKTSIRYKLIRDPQISYLLSELGKIDINLVRNAIDLMQDVIINEYFN